MNMIQDLVVDPKAEHLKLRHDAIERVERVDIKASTKETFGYAERPSHYKVLLKGETKLRRVYATPIGNVAVFYIKTVFGYVNCETALDEALHRPED